MAKKKKATRKAAKKKTTRAKATKKKAVKKATRKATKAKATKATARRATKAKATTATAARKAVAKDLSVRTGGFEKVAKTRTKGQVMKELSESTGLNRKEIVNFFDNLAALMNHDLTKGPGTFQIPGLIKVTVQKKKAVPARKGVNPFTGEEMMFKAKPARNVVRARPLKGLKDMVAKKR